MYGGDTIKKNKHNVKGNSVRGAAKDDLVVLKPKQAFLGFGGFNENSQITLNPVQSQKVFQPAPFT